MSKSFLFLFQSIVGETLSKKLMNIAKVSTRHLSGSPGRNSKLIMRQNPLDCIFRKEWLVSLKVLKKVLFAHSCLYDF